MLGNGLKIDVPVLTIQTFVLVTGFLSLFGLPLSKNDVRAILVWDFKFSRGPAALTTAACYWIKCEEIIKNESHDSEMGYDSQNDCAKDTNFEKISCHNFFWSIAGSRPRRQCNSRTAMCYRCTCRWRWKALIKIAGMNFTTSVHRGWTLIYKLNVISVLPFKNMREICMFTLFWNVYHKL